MLRARSADTLSSTSSSREDTLKLLENTVLKSCTTSRGGGRDGVHSRSSPSSVDQGAWSCSGSEVLGSVRRAVRGAAKTASTQRSDSKAGRCWRLPAARSRWRDFTASWPAGGDVSDLIICSLIRDAPMAAGVGRAACGDSYWPYLNAQIMSALVASPSPSQSPSAKVELSAMASSYSPVRNTSSISVESKMPS